MQRTRNILRALTVLGALSTIASAARAGGFTEGDLYLHTHGYPVLGAAIVRIDPVSGTKTVIHEPNQLPDAGVRLSYDPYRDRLVIREGPVVDGFVLIDHLGNTSTLPFNWAASALSPVILWAPAGDGRIFMMSKSPEFRFGYLDAAGQGHDILDTDGVTPLTYFFQTTSKEDLIYDAVTNSLFLVHWGAATQLAKFPLTPDGTQLAGAAQVVSYDAFPPTVDEPMGLSAGPNGSLFIKIDTNSNADGVRMFTVDPTTLQFSDFANIGYSFVGGNTAGTYNSVHGYGAALDSWVADEGKIRTYVQSGSVQEGAILATGVSNDGGTGEQARIISIGDTINGFDPCTADTDGSGAVDVTDLLGLLAAWGTADPTYDIAPPGGDGFVGVQDLLALLAAWGPC